MKKIALTAFAALFPFQAMAADHIWAGPYAGVSAGYIEHRTKLNDPTYNLTSGDILTHGDGGIFSADAGYNFQTGPVVYGVETDFGWSTAEYELNVFSSRDAIVRNKLDYVGTVRARIGFALDRALIYATGGYAYGRVDNYSTSDITDAAYGARTKGWQSGWTVGAGLEYAADENWTLRAEGLYLDLGSVTNYYPAFPSDPMTFHNSAILGRFGVNYKF